MKNRISLHLGVLFLLVLLLGIWMARHPRPPLRVEPPPPAAETIEASGEIFGLAIGSSMEAAREKLDALRVPSVYTPDAKEKSGQRIYWKLKETEFDWIMAWANPDGKISRMRAVYRPGMEKPFQEIGDLRAAASVTANSVKWNLRRPRGGYYRLIAQGPEQQAKTVYMFSLEIPGEAAEGNEPEPEDEE